MQSKSAPHTTEITITQKSHRFDLRWIVEAALVVDGSLVVVVDEGEPVLVSTGDEALGLAESKQSGEVEDPDSRRQHATFMPLCPGQRWSSGSRR